jgi:hypothetical protein
MVPADALAGVLGGSGGRESIPAPPEWIRPDVPQSAAWCGVDLALLDAFGRASGDPVSLGPNEEYQIKRKSLRYGAPVIRVVRTGEFDRYRRRMVETGQRADGQFKVLRLTSDTSFGAEFAAERDLVGGERTSA